ncbi:hypothetical protein PV10_07005 [Exophiala mesophila]|uniref:Uncharacterized protein n=1 Tax=Exophiala mesophila TaxID=212818 RepID=A0A0D1Z6U7_EXOME|nr:uncharacterized protein PV10_07005 [Exophiala mesophila]KIV89619.1 hypothetical protein PV10_07005 [Exophiala mesophila]
MFIPKTTFVLAVTMLLVASGLAAPLEQQHGALVNMTNSNPLGFSDSEQATKDFDGSDISHLGTLMVRGTDKGIWAERTNREEQFVQDTLSNLSNLLPEKNILIFHDQKSQACLYGNPYHEHFELNVDYGGRKLTKGYEIHLFDGHGTFTLHGDGGWRNWGVTGCYKRTGEKTVEFYKVSRTCPELYARKHYVYTTDNTPPTLADLHLF